MRIVKVMKMTKEMKMQKCMERNEDTQLYGGCRTAWKMMSCMEDDELHGGR